MISSFKAAQVHTFAKYDRRHLATLINAVQHIASDGMAASWTSVTILIGARLSFPPLPLT